MSLSVLGECSKRGHEQVVFFHYPQVGLKAIVAIHDTTLGPGVGGCRMRIYESEAQALDDVLRLSEGMTYKSSLAGLDLGGGKACLLVDPRLKEGREALFTQFGKCLNTLSGRYITAEDMGTNVSDMMSVRGASKFVVGTDPDKGGAGDPSPWTARGVFLAIKAASERVFGNQNLQGRRVAVQGVGHVGMYLLQALREEGAQVSVCDTNDSAVREAAAKFGAEVVTPAAIYDTPCDVFSPCAVGQTVNHETLQRLTCKIVAGAANNQISDPSVYPLIQKRNILYCPDFAINSGGIICVGGELLPTGWSREWVSEKVERIYGTTCRVLDEAHSTGRNTEEVAIGLAKDRIESARRVQVT
jgi:leucine dehydrogenase